MLPSTSIVCFSATSGGWPHRPAISVRSKNHGVQKPVHKFAHSVRDRRIPHGEQSEQLAVERALRGPDDGVRSHHLPASILQDSGARSILLRFSSLGKAFPAVPLTRAPHSVGGFTSLTYLWYISRVFFASKSRALRNLKARDLTERYSSASGAVFTLLCSPLPQNIVIRVKFSAFRKPAAHLLESLFLAVTQMTLLHHTKSVSFFVVYEVRNPLHKK